VSLRSFVFWSGAGEESKPEGFACRKRAAKFMSEAESARFHGVAEPDGIDECEMRFERFHGGKRRGADACFGSGRQLEDDGERAARGNERNCVFEAPLDTGMFEDKRGVHEIHWSERDDAGGKIETVKFQARQGGITHARDFEVRRIEVDAKDSLGARGIDMIEAVATGNAENCDRSGATERESLLEEVGERRELLDFRGAHVALIVGERNV
jgi:hypothetical protein